MPERDLRELLIVRDRALREQIERSFGESAFEPGVDKNVIKHISAFFVIGKSDGAVKVSCGNLLEKRRGVDEAQSAVRVYDRGFEHVFSRQIGVHSDVPYPLSGKGKRFAERIDNYTVREYAGNARYSYAVVNYFRVGFVRDNVHGLSEFLFRFVKNVADRDQILLRIYCPGRIVRRIQYYGLCLRPDRFGYGVYVRSERAGERSYRFYDAALIPDVRIILHKVRGQRYHLVARIQQRMERDGKACGRARHHDDLIGGKESSALLGHI